MNHYQLLNYSEAILWLAAAVVIRKIVVITEERHSTACNIAIIGFTFFAISDFIEASITREFHLWLWILKISCGVIFLTARICYVGRKDFKYTDRYFLFSLLCITTAIAVISVTMELL